MSSTNTPADIEFLRKKSVSAWWTEINRGLILNADLGSRRYRLPAGLLNATEHAPTLKTIIEALEKAGYNCKHTELVGWEVTW